MGLVYALKFISCKNRFKSILPIETKVQFSGACTIERINLNSFLTPWTLAYDQLRSRPSWIYMIACIWSIIKLILEQTISLWELWLSGFPIFPVRFSHDLFIANYMQIHKGLPVYPIVSPFLLGLLFLKYKYVVFNFWIICHCCIILW